MKKITLLSLIISTMLIFTGCIKTSDLVPSVPTDPTPPTPTGVGTPVGGPVSKTIGKDGGSVASMDGNAELIFPAGALETNIEISIQAISNKAPNGIGNSYRFLPEGINFLQPVTVKFHYTSDDLASTLADLMGIAYQDSDGGWWRINNFTNDTAHKIIFAPITHFSIWTAFDMLLIYPRYAIVGVSKSIGVEVQVIASDDELTGLGPNQEAPIVRSANTKPIVWTASDGSISGTSFYAANYTAPSSVPSGSRNPVNVNATIDSKIKYQGKTFDKTTLISSLRIVDAEIYLLEMKMYDTAIDVNDMMIVWDSVSMKVTIKDDAVTISEITNFSPRSNPTQLIYVHDAYYYMPDPFGNMNITAATGTITPAIYGTGPDGRLLALMFTQSGTRDPKFRYVADGNEDFFGGDPNPGYPLAWTFELLPDGKVGGDNGSLVGAQASIIEAKFTLLKN